MSLSCGYCGRLSRTVVLKGNKGREGSNYMYRGTPRRQGKGPFQDHIRGAAVDRRDGGHNGLRLDSPLMLDLSLTQEELLKANMEDDSLFYATPRFDQHLSDPFRQRLTELYQAQLKEGWRVLDMCASWDSHLPLELRLAAVVGHGMNSAELAANTRLTSYFVQDLNKNARLLSVPAESFEAVLCCAGIEYLQDPVKVLSEVCRVLRRGGLVILSFSSNCYAEKAVAGWIHRSMPARAQLVASLLTAAGFVDAEIISNTPDVDTGVQLPQGTEDDSTAPSFYAVMGRRPGVAGTSGDAADPSDFQSMAGITLREIDFRGNGRMSGEALERWCSAYQVMADEFPGRSSVLHVTARINRSMLGISSEEMGKTIALVQEAHALGIPWSAIPKLPVTPHVEDVRTAREHLSGMVASFLSSEL